MKREIIARVLEEADRVIKTKKTIREISKEFNTSKSTVHKDLHDRLPELDAKKYKAVAKIMQMHIDVRHIRGGESTRQKYSLKTKNKN